MPTIESIAERITPAGPQTLGRQVYARFQAEPDTLVIPVVEDGRPIGLIERDAFLLKYAGDHGHARYADRTVEVVMDAEPAIVESGVHIDAFAGPILNSGPGALLRGFIVTRDGAYWGVGTAVALLRAANEGKDHQIRVLAEQEQARAEEQDRALAVARGRSDFLDALNHDLRTPLNGMLAVGELLQRQPLGPNAQAHVQTIVDSSETLARILQNAMDLSRAEAGELILEPGATVLRDVMDAIQSEWEPRALNQGVRLMVGYEGDTELAGQMDGRRFKQVFDNLIGNALKFSRGGLVEVSLKARAAGGSVAIEARVRDNGSALAGLNDEDLFATFLKVADAGAAAGEVGLGLSICRHIVQAMNGRIWAERNQGMGVTLAFDLCAPQAVIEVEADTNVSEIAGLHLQSQPHVLIVDDNATNRVVAQALCEMFGCTSETAEDGLEALEAVQSTRYDLILMDIKMPRMDGVAATLAIRALDGPVSRTPIIALTANADPDDARRYVASGMASVVEKPIKPERLRMAVNAALSDSEAPAASGDARLAG
ncbi:MAG: response regulator [Brevundimonas sp.]|uniref:response regulator n=1 Tax=Brevundimonas sp. TaxID=1871086 RepID=UPI00391D2E44